VTVGQVMSVRVVSVEPDETVQLAIGRMMEGGVGSVAVCEGPRLAGIFTERDVLRLASFGAGFGEIAVGSVMTTALVTVTPDVAIPDAGRLMNEKGIRHLPVVEGENLLGMVGIRDVMRTLVERVWQDHDADARETARELLRRAR
jgi:CBS domain-containing protein